MNEFVKKKKDNEILVTVFTPTFNRGYIIKSLYESLKRQTLKDFEWVVIDDGSTDNTEELFRIFKDEHNTFDISYEKVTNGGKHRAINRGVKKARGKLFFIVDSDDYLTDDAIEKIIKLEATIPNEKKDTFAGVCECKGYSKDKIIGKTYLGEGYLDITMLEREKHGIYGDKAEVFYTEILKKYPFPEFEGEKFLTECVVWDKIAYDGYKLRFDNDVIYICDYLPDGLTAHYEELYDKNPEGYGLYIYQSGVFGKIRGLEKWKEYYRYYNKFKSRLGLKRTAEYLHMNMFILLFRMFGIKAFLKIYDK